MMNFFTSDAFNINYEMADSGLDQSILFIHGNLASSLWWQPTMELLKSTGTTASEKKLIAADWRGYGNSKGLTNKKQIDFERYATDYIELVESLNLKDINVVGHSAGGLISMLAILQRPDLFKSLTLLDSVGATGLELVLPKQQVLDHFSKMSQDHDYCSLVLAATIEGVDPESGIFQNLAQQAFDADKINFTGVIEELAENIDVTEKMNALQLPTLILHGDKDKVLPLDVSEKLHSQIKSSEFHILEGQGHCCNLENPQKFVDILSRFLRK